MFFYALHEAYSPMVCSDCISAQEVHFAKRFVAWNDICTRCGKHS